MSTTGIRWVRMFRWLATTATLVAMTAGAPATAAAAVFTLDTDPFDGSDALTTPGRQVVGGELFITFDPTIDGFLIDPAAFAPYGFGPTVSFVNDEIDGIPTSGANVIVLQTLDNDNDTSTPFNAGTAANLIADQVTASGAGFFIYFNQGLDLPRLVFSTDLSDNTADLKIVARFTNLTGAAGQAALADFNAGNFQAVPEPETALMLIAGGIMLARRLRRTATAR